MLFKLDPWCERSVALSCLMLSLLAGLAHPQKVSGKPVKLVVRTSQSAVVAGTKVEIEVTIQNTNNQAVRVQKDFQLELEIRQPSGKTEKMNATINTGEAAIKFHTQLKEPGLVEVRARHPELLEGSTFINVNASARSRPSGSKPASSSQLETSFALSLFALTNSGSGFGQFMPRSHLASLVIPQIEPAHLIGRKSLSKPLLTLCCRGQRRFLADGKDEAKIQLFLDEMALADLNIRLATNGGKLSSEVVTIPRGQLTGEARLTNDYSGTVTVNIQGSAPRVELKGDKELMLSFAPPISKLGLKTSPPKIYQGDRSDLIIYLQDDQARPVETDEPRKISLAIDSGRGEIEPKVFVIQPGYSEGRARFTPAESGKVVVSASTPSLGVERSELEVTRATVLLVWSAIGGLVGGLLAFWSRCMNWWRLPTGALTSQVFYWGFISGVLPSLPRVAVVNSWGAFALSVIGGWLGTEVFSLILRRFGLLPTQIEDRGDSLLSDMR
jgi:hypothetical protein